MVGDPTLTFQKLKGNLYEHQGCMVFVKLVSLLEEIHFGRTYANVRGDAMDYDTF
jgi:hypothetical protein